MVWPLLEVVDGALGEPFLASLAAHLGRRVARARAASPRSATWPGCSTATRCSGPRCSLRRSGRAARDGTDGLPADAAWQAELWRRLRARIGSAGPAERLEPACARLRADPALAGLPRRISLFGLTRLPAAHLRGAARAGAGHRRAPVPAAPLAGAVGEGRRGDGASAAASRRRARDATAALADNRLLASWGQDARELQLVVAGGDAARPPPPDRARGRTRCSARLQADVRADRRPPGEPLPGRPDARPPLDPGDRSVQVHSCHGRARQVEVLRDAILHLLQADPTLEPRDVIVMCPDIETFAPLIQATFGAGEAAEDDDELEARPGRAAAARPARPARGPLAAPDEPDPGCRRPADRPRRAAADRLAGARSRRPRAGAPALRVRRRGAGPAGGLGLRERDPLGPRRRPSRAVQARARCRRARGGPGSTGSWSA